MNTYDLERDALFTLTPIMNDIQKAGTAWTRRREATMSVIQCLLETCTKLKDKIANGKQVVIDAIPCRLTLEAQGKLFKIKAESNFNDNVLNFTIEDDKITISGYPADVEALVLKFAQLIIVSKEDNVMVLDNPSPTLYS